MSDFWLERAIARKAGALLELEVKGYPDQLAAAAVDRAWGAADYRTCAVNAAIRPQAFYDTLVRELVDAELWLRKEISGNVR